MWLWITIAIIAVLVIYVIATYNGLIRSRMQTVEAWSQIDVQLKRRNDLIPNLIETVKAYANYEEATFTKITELRSKVANAGSHNEAMEASDQLGKQVAGLLAVAENYPDLKANQNFLKLQDELTNTENKIAYSRQLYNSTTGNYNAKLQVFPSNIIAGAFGFKASEFLETPEEERQVPEVKFDGLIGN
jgi:LemA protein